MEHLFQGRLFQDRRDAGRRLADRLEHYREEAGVLLLALPRGGVPVAAAIASALRLPFDIFLVRKLGVPGQEELAMGAIASSGVQVLNSEVIRALGIHPRQVAAVIARERRELERRERDYRGGSASLEVAGRTAILVDDGLATGSSMRAAIAALRQQSAAKIAVAVPVAPRQTCAEIAAEVDDFVCLQCPKTFESVSQYYADFAQTGDEEVRHFLQNRNEMS
jgi:predicted phosphoribosyltransferase